MCSTSFNNCAITRRNIFELRLSYRSIKIPAEKEWESSEEEKEIALSADCCVAQISNTLDDKPRNQKASEMCNKSHTVNKSWRNWRHGCSNWYSTCASRIFYVLQPSSAFITTEVNFTKLYDVAWRVCASMSVSLFLLSLMVVVVDDLFLNAREEKKPKKWKVVCFCFKTKEEKKSWKVTRKKLRANCQEKHFPRLRSGSSVCTSRGFLSFSLILHTCFWFPH